MKFSNIAVWLQQKLSVVDDTGVSAGIEAPTLSAVRAKMKCNRVESNDYGWPNSMPQKKVYLGAIYGKEGENADYSKATPSGECWLQIDPDRPASGWFKPGKSYYVTFTEAPD